MALEVVASHVYTIHPAVGCRLSLPLATPLLRYQYESGRRRQLRYAHSGGDVPQTSVDGPASLQTHWRGAGRAALFN